MNQATEQPSSQATPLRGWITTIHVLRDGKRYGPYHVRRWKANGKLHREYIKPKDLERVRAACQTNRDQRKRQTQIDKGLRTFTGNWDFAIRIYERAEKGQGVSLIEAAHFMRILKEGWSAPDRPPLRKRREPFQISAQDRARLFVPGAQEKLIKLLKTNHPIRQAPTRGPIRSGRKP